MSKQWWVGLNSNASRATRLPLLSNFSQSQSNCNHNLNLRTLQQLTHKLKFELNHTLNLSIVTALAITTFLAFALALAPEPAFAVTIAMATMEAWPTRPNRGWLNNRPKGMKTTADFFREAQARDPYIPPAWMLPPKFELPKQESVRYEQSVQYEESLRSDESFQSEEGVRYVDNIRQEEIILQEKITVQEERVPEEFSAPREESGWDVDEDFTNPSEISMSTSPRVKIFTRAVPKRKMNFVELSEYFGKADNGRLAAANRLWPEEGFAEEDSEEDIEEVDENRDTLRRLSRISVSPKVESPLDLADTKPERLPRIPMSRSTLQLADTTSEILPGISMSPKRESTSDLADTSAERLPRKSLSPKRESISDLADTLAERLPRISTSSKRESTMKLADTAPERLELKAEEDSTLDAFESALSMQEHSPTCCERYHAQMTKLDHVKLGIRDVKHGLGRLAADKVPKTSPDIAYEETQTRGRFGAFAMSKWTRVVCTILFTLFLLECLLWGIYGRRTASTTNNWHPHDPWFGRCLGTKLNEWTGKVVTNTLVLIRDSINLIVDPDALRYRPIHPRTARMGANDWWQGRSAPIGRMGRMDPGILSDPMGF
ncbi:hypothetical protein BKA64DRAFT_706941 [Cadophora sp. MPI-SDFR-AT-0126]|nr:hypothetical protein BKA64DRAFT_706941 [Leotiomycetes sp. MPI-SDFR-AT-0126]